MDIFIQSYYYLMMNWHENDIWEDWAESFYSTIRTGLIYAKAIREWYQIKK